MNVNWLHRYMSIRNPRVYDTIAVTDIETMVVILHSIILAFGLNYSLLLLLFFLDFVLIS